MNLFKSKNYLFEISNSYKTFPISTVIAAFCAIFLAFLIFIDFYKSKEIADIIYFCLILISTSAVFENLKIPKNLIFRIVLICSTAICLYAMTNYISSGASGHFAKFGEYKFTLNLSVILILVALFALPIKLNITISAFVESLIVGVILTIVCLAFWITLNSLFRIRDEIFPASFVLAFAFCFVLLLGKIALNSVFEENKIFKAIYFLAFIYCVILWIYLLFRALNLVYPKISIVHLIIWFSAFWLILFWLKEQKTKFDKFFAFCILGLLCVSFYAILVRINQYGITPNRYFVVAFGGWIFLALCFSLANLKHKFMLILFACILAFSVFSPLNFLNASINSQLKIYENISSDNANLEKLRNIERFFENYGAKFNPKLAKIEYKTTKIVIETRGNLVIKDIAGFSYHFDHNLFQNKEFTKDGLDFYLSPSEIKISDKNKSIFELDFSKHLREKNGQKECDETYCHFNVKADEILVDNEKIKAKIFINSGYTEYSYAPKAIDSGHTNVSYDFYFSVKK